MLLLDPEVSDERRVEIIDEVGKTVESGGGRVNAADDWGLRKLAYEIDHRPDAAYYLFNINAGPDLITELGRRLKIADGVLRFRVFKQVGSSKPAKEEAAPVTEA